MAVLVEGLTTGHETKLGAHAISGVAGLQDALNAKEVAGAATSAVDGHAAKSGAHPISGVSGLQASLDSKFSASNKPAIADVTGLVAALDSANAKIVELEKWPQSGSNANGFWVKHRDGSMTCTLTKSFDLGPLTAYGAIYQKSFNWDYPSAFISPPSTSCGVSRGSSASWASTQPNNSLSNGMFRVFDVAALADATVVTVAMSASGRWK
ncbi:MAG: hypothetical protein ACRCVV_14575 [Shewanella sp.]|uniref:hypothetical protein n=1 Tax=Aeromonas popoffii TaxID=70856 RepID=UPI003F3A04C7